MRRWIKEELRLVGYVCLVASSLIVTATLILIVLFGSVVVYEPNALILFGETIYSLFGLAFAIWLLVEYARRETESPKRSEN